jgi:4-hydroxy-2-oxoglutarate aldolase
MLEMAGVFAPATTPFDPVTGDLDVVALRRNARRLLDAELAGIVLFGSTGEGWLLDEDERIAGLEAVASLTDERLILAGAAAESTRATIRLVRAAAAAGADGVLVAPPAYYKPQMTPDALRDHYRAVADACPVPVLLYQVPPVYSGVELRSGLVAELANHPNIAGIKDSTGNLQGLGELVERCPSEFAIIVGSGAAFYGALEVGARAGILAVADLVPEACNAIYQSRRAGDNAGAGRMQERIGPLHKGIVGAYGVAGVKAAMDLLGEVGGSPRSPLKPLREKDRAVVSEVLAAAGFDVTKRGDEREHV